MLNIISLQHLAMLLQVSVLLCLFSLSGEMQVGIIGGKVVKPHSKPYMVSLQHKEQHQCGGFLIREDFVLTSAHCLKFSDLEVVLGAHNIKKREQSQQRIHVWKFFQHPNYRKYTNAANWKNLTVDIMLLKLKPNATLNGFVKLIRLPEGKDKAPAPEKCTIAGWGMRRPNGVASDVLYETSLKTLSQSKCKRVWGRYYDADCMMCTETAKNNTFCQGDSGGPLICNSKPQSIASYTYPNGCNNPQYPGVYLKISPFINWIKDVMRKNA